MTGRRLNLRGGEKEGRFPAGFLFEGAIAIVEKDPVRQNVPIEGDHVVEGIENIVTPEKSGWGGVGGVNIFCKLWSGKLDWV